MIVGYPEYANFERSLKDLQKAWDNWKGGPMMKSEDVGPAVRELKKLINDELDKIIK